MGDDRQAIYGWRGADSNAIGRLMKGAGGEHAVLPLSITYRCPSKVVAIAKQIVPDYEAAPEAPEGEVVHGDDRLLGQVKAGDVVLSRKNAPLATLCLELLRRGVPAAVAGRDIAARIKGLWQKAQEQGQARDLDEALTWISGWASREMKRAEAREDFEAADAVHDLADTARAVADGCASLEEVVRRCEDLFVDGKDKESAGRRVTLSTVHRAKGLEWDQVFMLAATFNRDKSVEESNLWYVALTRAKRTLYLVNRSKDDHEHSRWEKRRRELERN